MSPAEITEETLAIAKTSFKTRDVVPTGLRKAGINLAEQLYGVNLEAPAKRLYPVYAPLRNRIARVKAAYGSNAVTWKQVDAINTANVWPGVAENTRNVPLITATTPQLATFKTLEMEGEVGFEALAASKGFEDIRALEALNTLNALMIGEEKTILGGNVAAVAAPTLTSETKTAGGSLADDTYKVKISSLVLRGFDQGATGGTGATSSDGESLPSSASSGITTETTNNSVTYVWGAVRGAVAYNIYIQKGSGSYYYQTTVTATKYRLTAFANTPAPNSNVPNAADTTPSTVDFDGIISQIEKNCTTQFVDQKGVNLTSDSAGGITEFETMLKSMWDKYRLGPTMILCNSQESANVTKLIGGDSGVQHTIFLKDGQKDIIGGIYVGSYLNKYSSSFAEGIPNNIPIKIHPNMPPGTILFIVEALPYANSQVPNVWEIETQQEYTQYEFAMTQRKYEFGVQVIEVLKGYFPKAQGAIVGIAA